MIGTSYLLYKKKRDDGKKEVILRINLTARNRPCFKSGVYIDEKYFKSVKLTGYGNQMGIVPSKQSKLNFKEVKEVTEAKSQLDNYTLRILKICQIAEQCPDITITKEWYPQSIFSKDNFDAFLLKRLSKDFELLDEEI